MRQVLVLLALLAVPGSVWAQDRAAELEARQQARIARLGQRSAALEWQAGSRFRPMVACPGFFGSAVDDLYGHGRPGLEPYALGGGGPWGAPYGPTIGYRGGLAGGFAGYAGQAIGCVPGYGFPYYDPYGFRYLPNPYEDWQAIWGRGWTDETAVPPYHRFQYRFFPETLPDPTRGGYVTPDGWRLPPTPVPSPAARERCAQIRVETGDGVREAFVALPVLGATTPDALRAVILDRLQRGSGVVVRDLDGFVFQFPPAPAIRELSVTDC